MPPRRSRTAPFPTRRSPRLASRATPQLPADVWGRIGALLNYGNQRAAHATSTEARRGMNNNLRKRTALKTAFRSATSRTIAPLVAALRSREVQGVINNEPRYYWYQKTVKVGRHTLRLGRSAQSFPFGISWLVTDPDRPASQPAALQLVTWEPPRAHFYFKDEKLPGIVTVKRLIKAALKEAFGTVVEEHTWPTR